MNFIKRIFVLTTYFTLAVVGINASSGELDKAFGTGGKVTTALTNNSQEYAADIAVQQDGKVVIVGSTNNNNNIDTVVVRYTQNGMLDTSFAGSGIIILPVSVSSYDEAYAVVIQPDGKILVGGYSVNSGSSYDYTLLRFNPDGTLDPSFGNGGKAITDFGNTSEMIADITLQPDGKIVAVGRIRPETGWWEVATARYNANGTLDTSFGTNGLAKTQFGIGDDGASSVALQSDGKIIVAGTKSNTITSNPILLRYNPDGTPDSTFDGDGIFITSGISIYSMLIQPDGKILIGGTASNGSNSDFALVRFNADASIDNSFDEDGKVVTPVGNFDDYLNDIVLQPDGKIVAGGSSVSAPNNNRYSVVRYNADGSLDSTFGSNGKLSVNLTSTAQDWISALALQPDGRIVAAGRSVVPSYSGYDISLARFNLNGTFDSGFGMVGLVSISAGYSSQANAMAIQPDGKIVAAGSFRNDNLRDDFMLTRNLPNGTPDASFGTGGIITFSPTIYNDVINTIALQPDGKIVVAGYAGNAPNIDMVVARFNPNGTPDMTFNGNGYRIIPLSSGGDDVQTVLVQPDGKIVLVGYTVGASSPMFAILRLTSSGLPDATFNGNGVVTTAVGSNESFARAGILQPDGKIIAAGDTANADRTTDFALTRYNSDGSLDTSFGINGIVVTSIKPYAGDIAADIALQPDGKIIAAGAAGSSDFALIRYNSNGSLDDAFGSDGIVVTSISNTTDVANAVTLQPDGKIVAAGTASDSTNANYDFAITRYNQNGSLDTSFDKDGIVITNYGNLGEVANAVAFQQGGKLVIAGGINNGSYRNFALVQYVAPLKTAFDYDGDGRADISVFRSSSGAWYISRSSNNAFFGTNFGQEGDTIAPADFDGDGRADISVFRAGFWYRLDSSTNQFVGLQFGISEDIPVAADYDGDGKADIAVFRPSNSTWYRLNSSDNQFVAFRWGASGDKPLIGDFDGDGKADYTVFRPLSGAWYVLKSSDNSFYGINFGLAEDIPTPADYDGDGKTDISVFRPSAGSWYRLNSSNNQFFGQQFGMSEDKPVAADYDGDGRADIAVFRASQGAWYIQRSASGFYAQQFGMNGDIPTPAAFR